MLENDIETEEAVLGALLLEPNAYLKVADKLEPTDFIRKEHSQVYEAMLDLFEKNHKIDLITVCNRLREKRSDISTYDVSCLTSHVASAAHIEEHVALIKERSIRRALLQAIIKLEAIGKDPTIELDEFLDKASTLTDNVLGDISSKSQIKNFKENIKLAIAGIQQNQQNTSLNNLSGVIPSLSCLREYIPIWENGNLIIVAARPGMGKTAFVLHEAIEIAQNAGPVLFFSLEMTSKDVALRALQRESNLSRYDFDQNMNPDNWVILEEAGSRLEKVGLFIDETPAISLSHLKAKIKIYKQRHGIKAVVVDYLQLMKADKQLAREQQVAEISKTIKEIAKVYQIPIFLVAQLNRQADARKEEGFKPKLSDLRESGSIEQDADIVILPYRPSYYFPEDPDAKGSALLIVAKNRHGKIGTALATINDTITKFSDNKHSF